MRSDHFIDLYRKTIDSAMDIILAKNKDYASDENFFENFEKAEKIFDILELDRMPHRYTYLFSLFIKHFIALTKSAANSGTVYTDTLDDKINDLINYLQIIRGMLHEESTRRSKTNGQ